MSDQYKPSENDGLRKDGQPGTLPYTTSSLWHQSNKFLDARMQQDSFAYGKVDPQEAGKQGGQTGGSAGGQASSGSSGSGGSGQFAGGKVDPVEAGRKGGQSS